MVTWHFLGKSAMDCDRKEDGWRKRILKATTEKMDRDMAFFGKECHGQTRRWMARGKKMDGKDRENRSGHCIFWGKSAMDGDRQEDGW